MGSVITLTTDFGSKDAYVASVKGVILSISRNANVVDICHSIQPQNILQASFVFGTAYRYFPEGTIHLVVVDPGVGSQRKAIILKTSFAYFLAPDNGVLSHMMEESFLVKTLRGNSDQDTIEIAQLGDEVEAVAITNPEFWLKEVSTTFHGRDIFAPVAARLSSGVPLYRFGEKIDRIHYLSIPYPYSNDYGRLVGKVLHIDNFGNVITNIKIGDLKSHNVEIEIGDELIHGISRFYAEKSGLAAIFGSSGYLEISLRNGNAADSLNITLGDVLSVTSK